MHRPWETVNVWKFALVDGSGGEIAWLMQRKNAIAVDDEVRGATTQHGKIPVVELKDVCNGKIPNEGKSPGS